MDDPLVNLKFLQGLVKHREELEIEEKMIDIGTCELHVVHGAFKCGIERTDWNIKETLKGSHQLLHDTPARRVDYVSVTQSSEYPLFFCATRWEEDKKVSDRLLRIWPNIKIINFWKSLPKRKQLSSKSFENVKIGVEDVLTPAKLSFFSYFASLFEPFLLKYQTKNPMQPYFYTDFVDLFRSVLKLIIKDEVVENCRSGNQLTKIDFGRGNVFKKNRDVTIGFSTESVLSDLKKKDLVKDSNIQDFYDNARKCVVGTIKKMGERCSLPSTVARNAIIFNPEIMLENTEGNLQKEFKSLLQHLVSLRIVSSHKADKVLIQYGNVKTDFQKAVIHLPKISRLDDFYLKEDYLKGDYINGNRRITRKNISTR